MDNIERSHEARDAHVVVTVRRARTRFATAVSVVLLTLAAMALGAPAAQAHHAPSLPGVNIQPPFSGYWDRFGGTSPAAGHHRPFGGDLAFDFYRGPGAGIKVRAWPVSQVGAVSYRVAAVQAACRSGLIADGGYAVKVEFHYGGHNVGHAWYVHVDRPQVTAGQWIGHAATIGYTSRFRYSSCYQVNTDTGVHVHQEYYSNRHYACFIRRPAGAWVDYWGVLGRVGGNYAWGANAACP